MPPTLRPGEYPDPYPGYNFQVVVNSISDDGSTAIGAFSEVSGLDVEIDSIEYRNGNEAITVRKLPGLRKQTNLTFKRGLIGDPTFWNWIKSGLDGAVDRREGAIILNDENQVEVMRWTFARGWPCKYSGPTLNAANNEISMESLDICVEELILDV